MNCSAEADGFAIHIVSEAPERAKPVQAAPTPWPSVTSYLTGVASVGVVIALGVWLPDLGTPTNVAKLFLAGVLFSAIYYGTRPAIATALAAFLGYNFFFTEPRFTLQVEHWRDLLALGVFLVVAIATGALTGRVRNQALAERARITALRTLFNFSKRLGGKTTIDDLGHAVVLQIHRMTGHDGIFLLPEDGDLAMRYAWPPKTLLQKATWQPRAGRNCVVNLRVLAQERCHRPMGISGR